MWGGIGLQTLLMPFVFNVKKKLAFFPQKTPKGACMIQKKKFLRQMKPKQARTMGREKHGDGEKRLMN